MLMSHARCTMKWNNASVWISVSLNILSWNCLLKRIKNICTSVSFVIKLYSLHHKKLILINSLLAHSSPQFMYYCGGIICCDHHIIQEEIHWYIYVYLYILILDFAHHYIMHIRRIFFADDKKNKSGLDDKIVGRSDLGLNMSIRRQLFF